MSDPIAARMQGFIAARAFIDDDLDECGLTNKDAHKLAKQIRQQIGRELLEGESWAVPRHKVVEVCQLGEDNEKR